MFFLFSQVSGYDFMQGVVQKLNINYHCTKQLSIITILQPRYWLEIIVDDKPTTISTYEHTVVAIGFLIVRFILYN